MDTANDLYVMVIGTTIVLLLLVSAVISLLFIYQRRQIRNQMDLKKLKDEFDLEILRSRLEMREQTLQNISEEIHDNVGQMLALANLNLSSIELEADHRDRELIDRVMTLLSKAIGDLRNLSRTLDPENISSTRLADCIQFELDLLEKTGKYKTSLELNGSERPLNAAKQLLVYRIAQEAINNIIKHASATTIQVALHYTDAGLSILITDNGTGFREAAADNPRNGAGLRNMKNRAKLVQGALTIHSSQGGTRLSLALPLEP
jgi:two-component system, NarL family, sensor kinase